MRPSGPHRTDRREDGHAQLRGAERDQSHPLSLDVLKGVVQFVADRGQWRVCLRFGTLRADSTGSQAAEDGVAG